jgi:carboxypeptidase family protein/TonB-dependent receptor-like protein
LRAFEYFYTGLPAELAAAKAGGRVEFVRLPTAHWIVSRWSIRMPQTAIRKGVSGVGVHARIEERTFVRAIHVTRGETMDVERGGVSLYHVAQPAIATPERTVAATSDRAPVESADSAAVRRPANGARGAVVSGRITPEHDTVGIRGVEVELVGSGMRGYTDAKGQFRFAGVAEGSYDLSVRLVGYQPWVAHMSLLDGRLYDSDIRLQRLPSILSEVQIEGRMVQVPVRFADVYQRAALGRGKFFTREDIDRLNPLDVKTLLSTIPGVVTNDRGITFPRCQVGFHGMSIAGGQASAPAAAAVQVYIDGTRMTHSRKAEVPNPNSGVVLADDYDVEHALKIVPPTAIQAIEVYVGVAQIPAEFLEDACAVIAIWTKSH